MHVPIGISLNVEILGTFQSNDRFHGSKFIALVLTPLSISIFMIFRSFLTATLTTLLLGAIVAPNVNAASKTVTSDGTTIGQDDTNWFLRTPVSDTTQPFDGGILRVYDVHIAKMVEITHQQCTITRNRQDRTWFYFADDQNMGRFRISCKLANDLVVAYGLGKSETTGIFMAEADEPSTVRIPTLNITGGKIKSWMNFTQNFKPRR